ncbi:monocarboxylate transporter 5 isoform X2 [Strongylocentrotus purpuratus]|uniref:Uncharacterized protein n=1 Tax=Strongylocentrotus purpuratus TaxID=7668 RepID=A0A7M7PAV7_STRPU|nr:monocarboxylate transporter 5 isoform X2 [Strongylocentrotus purpuratus]
MTCIGKRVAAIAGRSGDRTKQDDVDLKDSAAKVKVTCKALWEDPMYFRWVTTFIWALVGAFNFGIIGDFTLFFIYLEEDLKSSVLELNWLGTLPWILFTVFAPLTTPLVKVLGYRSTLVGSNLACALGLFATSFPHQIWPMYITYSLVYGGGAVIYYVAGCFYITGYFDQKSCTGPVSSMGFFFELAVLVFSPVIQVTADAWGWRWSLRLLSACTLVVSGLLIIFIRKPPLDLSGRIVSPISDDDDQRERSSNDHESYLELATTKAETGKVSVTTSRGRYLKIMSMPSFWILELTVILSFTSLSFSLINLLLIFSGLSTYPWRPD